MSLRIILRPMTQPFILAICLSFLPNITEQAVAQDLITLPPEIERSLREQTRPIDREFIIDLGPQETRWDFEDGTLHGFTYEPIAGRQNAFEGQPTLGENVSASRAMNTSGMRMPADPCEGLVLDELTTCEFERGSIPTYYRALRRNLDRFRADLAVIGGNFADGPFPIGKQGKYWIGTYENRPSYRAPLRAPPRRSLTWGTTQGDAPQGRLISPTIELGTRYFSLLVGGGCSDDVGVYLQTAHTELRRERSTFDPRSGGAPKPGGDAYLPTTVWRTLLDSDGQPIEARGVCIENMVRRTWDIRHLAGVQARVVIEDRSSGGWGHINVDDILFSNRAPAPTRRDTDPVWGVADLHAHLMNEKGFIAYDASGNLPEARALWGSALGPISDMRPDNQTHTTSGWNFNSFYDPVHGSTYTLCRDVCLNLLEGAGLPDIAGDQVYQDGVLGGFHSANGGFPNFRDWPMWYSAIHQQMHWSWVRRAHQGGLRMMVASVGNSEVISFALVKERDRQFTSDQDALAMQIPAIKEFARQNADWAEVVYTPRQARAAINEGKLAIVIGVELDHVMDNCGADITRQSHHRANEHGHPGLWVAHSGYDLDVGAGVASGAQFIGFATRVMYYRGHPRTCSAAQIEARIDALYREGVRQIIPMHFSDNMLGGYAINGGLFVASAIFGNPDALPPRLQNSEELVANYGRSARPFEPVAREAYFGENDDRRRDLENQRPIKFKLEEISIPIWARLEPEAILDPDIVPPGIGRTIAEFLMGDCIEDDGWRIFTAIITGGISEATCLAQTVTAEAINAARSTLPFEGATDSPAMIPNSPTGDMHELAFHVNARGLTNDGRVFLREMMRRGMMIDIQHSSDLAKRQILDFTGYYPTMASHGGVQDGSQRANENVLSYSQLRGVYQPPDAFKPGIVGLGTQSAKGVIDQIRTVAGNSGAGGPDQILPAIAIGTDINGIDWHAPPRFGRFGYYGKTPAERNQMRLDNEIGMRVGYAPYPSGTNPWSLTSPTCSPACPTWNTTTAVAGHPPLNALQITNGGRTTRTFDINFDGLAHFGMIPDFMQELRVLGATPEELGALYKSADGMITMWEENCFLAYQMENQPGRLSVGCGPASLYR